MTLLRPLAAVLFLAFAAAPALAQDKYGAVAVGPNGAYGWAVDYDTEKGAADAALKECGNDCDGITFVNSCASIALGSQAGAWGVGDSRAEAERNALAECSKKSAGCAIKVWGCTAR